MPVWLYQFLDRSTRFLGQARRVYMPRLGVQKVSGQEVVCSWRPSSSRPLDPWSAQASAAGGGAVF